MILGILSDTHGRADAAHRAVKLLLAHNAQYLIHCGDVGAENVLDALAGTPAMFVFGNNDYDFPALSRYAQAVGVSCGLMHGKLSFNDKRLVVTHGDDQTLMAKLLKAQQIDYLFVGHTHVPMDRRSGRVRIINPGALHRAAVKTVAVLDTETDHLKFLSLDSTPPGDLFHLPAEVH